MVSAAIVAVLIGTAAPVSAGPSWPNWLLTGAVDVDVSNGMDPFPDPVVPYSATQNTSAIAVAPALGPDPEILCSVYNDGYHLVVEEEGYNGFSRSTDGGATWLDLGALGSGDCDFSAGTPQCALGDPSVVWSEVAGQFFFAALEAAGIGLWSSAGCSTASFVGNPDLSATVARPFLAVDNWDASPSEGRLHLVWTGFDAGNRIFHRQSDDGGASWTSPLALSTAGADVQAAWPAVAPDGSLLVAWARWDPFPNGDLGVELVRVEEVGGGGLEVTALTPPMAGQVNPRDAEATSVHCGQPALPGRILYVPAPQLVVDPAGRLHAVYSYDPDGFDVGDVADVFYRRSTDGGLTWEPELTLDPGADDLSQYFPTVSVGPSSFVSAAWYESELGVGPGCLVDPCRWEQSTYRRVSFDGGVTWDPVEKVSDEPSLIALDPGLPTCYHGNYDQQIQTSSAIVVQWADDRTLRSCELAEANCCAPGAPGCCDLSSSDDPDCPGPPWAAIPDAEVWTETVVEDFRLRSDPLSRDVCIPAAGTVEVDYDLDFFWFQGFFEEVDLSATAPTGTSLSFTPDPVPNGASSSLTIDVAMGATAGTHPIVVSADSTTTAVHRETTATLNLFQLPPVVPGLVPVPGASLDTLRPELEWGDVTLASAYEVEVATDPAFTDVVFSDTTSDLSTTVDFDLAPSTVYYWRVWAVNACGEGPFPAVLHSFTTRTVPRVLVVDDDDDTPDVYPFYEPVLTALLGPQDTGYDYWTTENSDDEPTAEELTNYEIVIWFTGNEFGGFAGPGSAGEAALAEWLDDEEGCLILTSQDYHFDRGLTEFMEDYFGVESVVNDTVQTEVTGAGTLFGTIGSLSLVFPYDNLSDTITADATAETAFDGDQGVAAIQRLNQPWSTIYMGFPLETLPSSAALSEVLSSAMESRCRGSVIFQDDFENRRCDRWDGVVGWNRCQVRP